MSAQPASSTNPLSGFEQLRYAREVLRTEGQALVALADRLGQPFCDAVELIYACRGSVIVSGMGKAGLVGAKIAASLASLGTPSHYLHPGEAMHGDLGRIARHDVVLLLSFSGETEEVVRVLPWLGERAVPLIAVTGNRESTLAEAATVVLDLGGIREACPLGLAPSTSTTAMLALGDALALVTSQMRNFDREDFARFHPGGSLGRKLSKVEHHLRGLGQCRVAADSKTVREVFVDASLPGRRTGAIMLVDAAGTPRKWPDGGYFMVEGELYDYDTFAGNIVGGVEQQNADLTTTGTGGAAATHERLRRMLVQMTQPPANFDLASATESLINQLRHTDTNEDFLEDLTRGH